MSAPCLKKKRTYLLCLVILSLSATIEYLCQVIGRAKSCHTPLQEYSQGVHLASYGHEPVGGYITKSVTHGQCDVRPTVTFPAVECNCSLNGNKLYCLVTHRCK